ncbi:hypothetical protein BC834DRAFT_835056 [Gloeopeniophorella convolvens]|nr:hypothetical protein BC834DRAFT_835056 [Gloeopeniophorella convolvens]
MQFTTIVTHLFAIFTVALMTAARSKHLVTRDVYAPPVTYPHAGTVWKVGQYHNVTWDTSDPPQNITNAVGRIVLVKNGEETNFTLASCFYILIGRITVQVPEVAPGSDYSLVLFGDSGNFSPTFTITD